MNNQLVGKMEMQPGPEQQNQGREHLWNLLSQCVYVSVCVCVSVHVYVSVCVCVYVCVSVTVCVSV